MLLAKYITFGEDPTSRVWYAFVLFLFQRRHPVMFNGLKNEDEIVR
jgi:hypothetical protein